MASYPPLVNKTIEGFRFLLNSIGQQITVRNPVKVLTDPNAVWYTTLEYFHEFTLRALPITEGEYDDAYRVQLPQRRVGAGRFSFAFIKGEQDVSTVSIIGYQGKHYPVREVRGRVWFGSSPLIQHAVVEM